VVVPGNREELRISGCGFRIGVVSPRPRSGSRAGPSRGWVVGREAGGVKREAIGGRWIGYLVLGDLVLRVFLAGARGTGDNGGR